MQRKRQTAPLCFLTDFNGGEDRLRQFLAAGISWVQYRDKTSTRRMLFRNSEIIRKVTAEFGAFFTVNDHADIASAVDADGLHLGQDDLTISAARRVFSQGIIGISTHTSEEALAAPAAGADYIGFGPVFPTKTKDAGSPKGVGPLSEIRMLVSIPIVAIGGISADNCGSVMQAGARGIAVSSELSREPVHEAVSRFLSALRGIPPLPFD